MTRDKAIEECAKAMLKRRGYTDQSNWQNYPAQHDLAMDIIACLEALELFKPTS